MELNVLWFILVAVLFTGFFFLEGFDYGVGILLPFLGKNDLERRMIINSIGPVWDGNEVWMITAGGALFAAFPHVYATLFSGFYMALFLILMALILRGVAMEFRSKDTGPGWRRSWDWTLFAGSLIPALLWGVAVTNLIQGVPIDAGKHYTGGFFDLLSPYTLSGGLTFLFVFIFHGALFLTLKVEGELIERARSAALKAGVLAAIFCLSMVGLTYTNTRLFDSALGGSALLGAVVTFVLSYLLTWKQKFGWGFAFSGFTILLTTAAFFAGLFPNLMVSSLNPAWNLTVYNASSTPYTLKIMTMAALTLVPVVLIYQGWTYWIFRKRVSAKQLEY
ncbi:cytochrome ubiquinol oxidase subunit 2 [Lucifera butyrica]|uniref:Cytochrome ubiquinol oxidase subunit 2 n=1 Tax=Lucifera butyrica TaxID=1351585 RepID=A0A498QXY6_9FIRM|nr:cytochrome d ubiquinol oxidase subunit II [Lucifera butyrica]VBB05016.1 cytochrome ubiquinol oxidase subunit 2 [Lucifera butyrica]